jgi:ubiquitin-protein ligase
MSLSLCKDFCVAQKRSLFGDAAQVEFKGDSTEDLILTLTPPDGPFGGTLVKFALKFSDYGASPPAVSCLSDIYHPNVSPAEEDGEVCLNILDEDFSTELRLADFVQGLLFLLYNPELGDPLTEMDTCDMDEYLENLKQANMGSFTNECSGFSYPDIRVAKEDEEEEREDANPEAETPASIGLEASPSAKTEEEDAAVELAAFNFEDEIRALMDLFHTQTIPISEFDRRRAEMVARRDQDQAQSQTVNLRISAGVPAGGEKRLLRSSGTAIEVA